MTTHASTERTIFLEAIEKPSAAERNAFVEGACLGNPQLQAEVQVLLRAHQESGDLLDAPEAIMPTLDQPTERIGAQIGPYKLLEQIGEGGMGLVYMAEQERPLRRLVALKLIKPGMDSKQVIARFEAEKQALAMMDHENIAKVFEAGTTDTGRFYFAMELVRGIPINEFCDQKHLSVRERLELFIQVCQAVQHAHQKGVIHRDLKPTNVLVTLHDALAVPKVIDFGIAKALGQQLTEHTLHTGFAQLVGTPLYMSPEQAEMNQLGVDTRSDVYSLGVLLYELLTGTTPFDKDRLKSVGLDEMRRIIREDEPETVSARIARTRRVGSVTQPSSSALTPNPQPLAPRLSELDWIVMKSLEKDRTRRYESASALAADIQRYLSDEPVLACPPTTMYRFRKFARKHKPTLVTAAAIALCLVLGTTVSAWQAVRATTAETQANANANQAQQKAQEATTQRDEAQRQRDEVKALNEKLAAKDQQLQRTLYVAHMNLAQNSWDAGGVERVRELLEQHRPKLGESDLRGFEWHYLYRLSHAELLTLKGGGPIANDGSVAYSPDGKRLASIGRGMLKVWDAQTGQEILSFKDPGNILAFSPDGKRLASGEGYGTIAVWDAQTGEQLLAFKKIAHTVNCLAFSPDGMRLASGFYTEPTVKVWDSQSGQEVLSLKGHTGDVQSVAFSPDGERLASGSDDRTVKVWNAQTGQELFSFKGKGKKLTFSPDGKRLASVNWDANRTMKVWDAQTGEELITCKGHTSWIWSVAFSQDGKRLASASNDKTVKVWDAETGRELLSFLGHTEEVLSVAFSPDSMRLASTARDGTVKVWDAQAIQKRLTLKPLKGPAPGATIVAFSADGKRLATASGNTVKLWDAQSGQELLTPKTPRGDVLSLAFSADGKRLVTASDADDETTVKVWDVQTGQELLSSKGANSHFCSVAFSPDGKRLAFGGGFHTRLTEPSQVKVWDAETGQELLSLKGHAGGVYSVAFSADGQRLASAAQDTKLKIWDVRTGQELLTFQGPAGFVNSVVFSPDGKRLASASGGPFVAGNELKVWDALTGEELLNLRGHTGRVTRVVYSPDGKRLASCSSYGTGSPAEVKVWDAETGDELLTFEGAVRNVAFNPSGHRLAGGSGVGTVTTWDATPLPEKP